MCRKLTRQIGIAYRYSLVVIFVSFFFSCDNQTLEESQSKAFFDLKGFIEIQVRKLITDKPMVSKTMGIDKEKNHISSREIDWKKELELFVQADINKSAYRQSYNITRPDSVTVYYILRKGQDLPVRYLRIALNKPYGSPVRISAMLMTENKLYRSEKNIDLSCMVNGGVCSLTAYRITGYQKLAMTEKKPFEVDAKVNY